METDETDPKERSTIGETVGRYEVRGRETGAQRWKRPRAFDFTQAKLCVALHLGRDERNVPYDETNPPILDKKTAVIQLRYNELRNKQAENAVGSFGENEPTGRGVMGEMRAGTEEGTCPGAPHRGAATPEGGYNGATGGPYSEGVARIHGSTPHRGAVTPRRGCTSDVYKAVFYR